MMAITTREQQLLDLADAGMSPAKIADRLGIKEKSVRRTLDLLRVNPVADRRMGSAIARGSAVLLDAIAASYPHRVCQPGTSAQV
jgi:predicted ArsR family transcriptional regulator